MASEMALREAASRYRAAEWAARIHADEPVMTPEHNARVQEWRAADAALAALLGESSPYAAVLAMLPPAATPSPDAGEPLEIRHAHPYGFRSGQWATVTGIVWRNDRPCYRVLFPDGVTDSWVVIDPDDPYEFRRAALLDEAPADGGETEAGT